MTLVIPDTVPLLVALALGCMIIAMMPKKEPSYPPQVPSIFPWIGSMITFSLKRAKFLELCLMRYGSVFKIVLGGRRVTIVASPEIIHDVLMSEPSSLSTLTRSFELFRVVGGDSSLYQLMHDISFERLFPMLDKSLNKRSLNGLSTNFVVTTLDRMKRFDMSHQVSLRRSLTEPLYVAVSVMLLGKRFPPDTYDDFLLFYQSLPPRFAMWPFWSLPSTMARGRLLQEITKYIEGTDSSQKDYNDNKLAENFVHVFREHNLPIVEGSAPMILAFQLTLHINTFNVIFWLITWLLADPTALSAVRDEIDKAVQEEFGGIQGFAARATPENLDSPSFTLLHSAILETLRLCSVLLGPRDVKRDFDLKDGDRTVPVRKGEMVVAFLQGANRNESTFPGSHMFVANRFVDNKGQGIPVNASYIPLGGGKHVCRGRAFSIYVLKVLAIIHLSLFDMTPVPQGYWSSKWEPPQPSPQCIGTMHTNDDVFVKLCPRFAS
ncbi:cytochrome P450 [Scleroderma yunnanense]